MEGTLDEKKAKGTKKIKKKQKELDEKKTTVSV